MSDITITITGPVGSGKPIIASIIAEALKSHGGYFVKETKDLSVDGVITLVLEKNRRKRE